MVWISADEVKQYSMIKYEMLGFDTDDDYLNWISEKLLPRCESIINNYCGQTFTDATADGTVKTVCALLAAETLKYVMISGQIPIVQVGTATLQVAAVEIFSKNLKDLLRQQVTGGGYVTANSYQTSEMQDTWDE